MKELDKHFLNYVGIDEAGRGCVGGSMFFVGCKLKNEYTPNDIAFAVDSKVTKKEHRKIIYERLLDKIDFFSVKTTAIEIDKNGLSLSIKNSLTKIKEHFFNENILYDGNSNYKVENIETLVKADSKVTIVSAASIIAKYLKDLECEEIDKIYPEYGFINHSGYVNHKHCDKIIEFGYSPFHRKSYNIKKLQNLEIKDNLK